MWLGILALILLCCAVAWIGTITQQQTKRGCGRGCATCGNRSICHSGEKNGSSSRNIPASDVHTYDRKVEKPVIRASICNGEQVAGFKNLQTGKFSEVMLIRGDHDLNVFLETYGIEQQEVTKEY